MYANCMCDLIRGFPGIPSRKQYGGFVFVRSFLRKRCEDDFDLFYGRYDENARENQPP